MEIEPLDRLSQPVEHDVIESVEARAIDFLHLVVGREELLLPSHEDVLAVLDLRVVVILFAQWIEERAERRSEAWPVLSVGVAVGVIFARQERVPRRDDFALEEGGQRWVFVG